MFIFVRFLSFLKPFIPLNYPFKPLDEAFKGDMMELHIHKWSRHKLLYTTLLFEVTPEKKEKTLQLDENRFNL